MMRNMTLGEFADKYRVCRATVSNWCNAGLLTVLQVGGRILITPSMETEFLERHSKGQHHKAA